MFDFQIKSFFYPFVCCWIKLSNFLGKTASLYIKRCWWKCLDVFFFIVSTSIIDLFEFSWLNFPNENWIVFLFILIDLLYGLKLKNIGWGLKVFDDVGFLFLCWWGIVCFSIILFSCWWFELMGILFKFNKNWWKQNMSF